MKPEDAIALYRDHSRQRHLSEATVTVHEYYLKHLADYCRLQNLTDLRDATTETLLDFHRWIKQRQRPDGEPISTTYINHHTRRAKALFKFLADRHYIMTDIGKNFPPLRDPKTLPRGILDKDQALQLLQQPNTTTPLGFRDRTILEVFYSTAIRAGELCRLTLYDFDPQERMLRIVAGKGKKDRVVPVGKVATGYLVEYLKNIRPILHAAAQRSARGDRQMAIALLFLSATGLRLHGEDLRRIVKTYRRKTRLPENITPHSLRHTCATEMLKGGASIRHVQELLGHADIQTTQIYTHVVPLDLQKAHARTAPSERRRTVEDVRFDGGVAPRWTDNRNASAWKKLHTPQGMEKPPEKTRKRRRKG